MLFVQGYVGGDVLLGDNRLHGGNGRDGDRSSNSLNPSGWGDANGDRTVMHVDWPVDVEDPGRMRDFAVGHAHGEDDAATLERLRVHVCFVLRQPATEHPAPQPRLTHADPVLVKNADVVGMKAARLQRFDGGLGVSGGVERGNNGLIILPTFHIRTAVPLRSV
jgi:hypothetical protein